MELIAFLGFWSLVAVVCGAWSLMQTHKEKHKESME